MQVAADKYGKTTKEGKDSLSLTFFPLFEYVHYYNQNQKQSNTTPLQAIQP